MRCPSCKKSDTFRPWEGPIKMMGVDVLARGMRCDCGEILFEEGEVERQERDVASGFVARGIGTGREFKLVRKVAGFRANEIAELFGVVPETVSRWERDEVSLPRTVAYAMGELYERPRVTRQKLEALRGARRAAG